ncbi:MAG TPA: ATP-binding cassette domain-containing protein [Candidatus Binatia bacterium]|jgi:ABC-2 type transport system ATP-binding protein|nr:ATP-binding cassette domain-containing protein [Candidatus Binatia bacterium]
MEPIIDVKELSKRFKGLVAVDKVSFQVQKGEIFGFLGPNGAGKSTTIGMLATLVEPTSGDATVAGRSIRRSKNGVRQRIALVFQDPSLDDRLTASENLRFHAELYAVPKRDYAKREEEVLRLVDLWDRKNDIVKTYSGGMKRRLEIARGLIHYPEVLFLDEPTLGLDPQTRAHLWEYILTLKKERGMTIFMTTHYMNEAEYCDRIAIIDRGTIVALDTPSALKRMVGEDVIVLKCADKERLRKELKDRYGFDAKDERDALRLEVEDGAKFLTRLFNELDTKIEGIELRRPTLEDVFLKLTGKKIREEEPAKSGWMKHMARRA